MQSYTSSDTPCHFLKLPPELRNALYEHVFDCTTNREVELRTATPPSKSLILTCRHVCKETAKMYKTYYRRYWTTTHFIIAGDNPNLSLDGEDILASDSEALDHINHLSITCLHDPALTSTWQWYISTTFTLSCDSNKSDRSHWILTGKIGSESNWAGETTQYILPVPPEEGDPSWPVHGDYQMATQWAWCSRWHEDEVSAVDGMKVGRKEQIVALMETVRISIRLWKDSNEDTHAG